MGLRRLRCVCDKGAVLVMAFGLLLLAMSWVDVTTAHHLVRERQSAAEEMRQQAVWAARDIWKEVDRWMADVQEFDSGTDKGLRWSGHQVTADPPGVWRSAETVDDEFIPEGVSDCDGTGLSVCWRISNASYDQPAIGPPQQTLAIIVGVWCDGIPDPSAPPNEQGCGRFSVETRRYEHRTVIRYMQHYDTDRIPSLDEDGNPPDRWPAPLLPLLGLPGESATRVEFPNGYRFVADYHTNENTVLVCGTPVISPGVEIAAYNPLSALEVNSVPVLPDGWEPRDECELTSSIPGGQTVINGGQIRVTAGLSAQQDATASTAPNCSVDNTSELATVLSTRVGFNWEYDPNNALLNRRMWQFDEYLPPGSAWLAEAKAIAERSGTVRPTAVLTHGLNQTYTDPTHRFHYNSDMNAETENYEYLTSYSGFNNPSIDDSQRAAARTVAYINLNNVADGQVLWSSADITEIEGMLLSGRTATVAAAGTIYLMPKETASTVGAHDGSALALMAGCHIEVRTHPGAHHPPSNLHVKNVAAVAPAGIVYAEWSTRCPLADGAEGPCNYGTHRRPPTLTWTGSIASRHRVTFGVHNIEGEVLTGYQEVNDFPAGWSDTRFPWWPKLIGGAWQPA